MNNAPAGLTLAPLCAHAPHMAKSPYEQQVAAACDLVNEGASIGTALEACGLTRAEIQRLRKDKRDPSWRLLRAAHAAARAGAEMAVRRDKPDVWLTKGPARATGLRSEAWTQEAPPVTVVTGGTHTDLDLSRLSIEELQALYAIESKLAQKDSDRPAASGALKA